MTTYTNTTTMPESLKIEMSSASIQINNNDDKKMDLFANELIMN
jgi:hypothetical protein